MSLITIVLLERLSLWTWGYLFCLGTNYLGCFLYLVSIFLYMTCRFSSQALSECDLHSSSSPAISFACPAFPPPAYIEGPYLDCVDDLLLVLSLCSLTHCCQEVLFELQSWSHLLPHWLTTWSDFMLWSEQPLNDINPVWSVCVPAHFFS